jgi:hypothetical protein
MIALLLVGSFFATACTNQSIPPSVAAALATEHGGSVIATVSGHDTGLAHYTFLICDAKEKVHKVEVFGTATEPQTHTTPADVELYCGSRSDFWTFYDEKAQQNRAVKEEFDKYKELFGFKQDD